MKKLIDKIMYAVAIITIPLWIIPVLIVIARADKQLQEDSDHYYL